MVDDISVGYEKKELKKPRRHGGIIDELVVFERLHKLNMFSELEHQVKKMPRVHSGGVTSDDDSGAHPTRFLRMVPR